MQHLDEGTLQTWLDRERAGLDPSELAEIEGHLAICGECAARLEELAALDGRTHALLGVGAQSTVPATPPFEDIVQRARGTRDRQRALSRLRSMAWAASIVLALGVGWMTNDIYRGGGATMDSPAALPQPEQERAVASDAAEMEVLAGSAVQANEAAPEPRRREAADAPEQAGRSDDQLERLSTVADADAVARNQADERQAAGLGAQSAGPAAAEPTAAPAEPLADANAPTAARAALPGGDQRALADVVTTSSRDTVVLQGRVQDGQSGQGISSVSVYVEDLAVGVLTDQDGRYALRLPVPDGSDTASYEVVATRIGYETQRLEVAQKAAQITADFTLQEQALALQEVVVAGTAGQTPPSADATAPTEWRTSSLTRAQSETGITGRYVEDLEVLSVETTEHPQTGAPLLRIRQRLASGGMLTLVEGPTDPEREAWAVEAAGAVESIRVGGLLITATAPVSSAELRALLTAVR